MAWELSIAPGQVYVEVEYDYEYKARGDRLISIHQGDCFILIKKTNEDWWQVRAQEGGRAFYVPAQYVREARRALMPPPRALLPPTTSTAGAARRTGSLKDYTPTVPASATDTESNTPLTSPSPNSSPSGVAVDKVALMPPGGGQVSVQPNWKHGSLPRTRATSPPRGERKEERGGGERDEERRRRGRGGERDGEIRNDSSSGDELSSSSTELLQPGYPAGGQRPESPLYSNLAELKLSSSSLPPVPSSPPLHIHGSWETHLHSSGRHFYYNTHTHECSWKPPRTRDSIGRRSQHSTHTDTDTHTTTTATDNETQSSEEVCLSTYSSQSDSQYGSPPRGWSEELDEYGHILYVCDYTNEKWIKHTDDQGRQYYYSADGSRSEWELPKLVQGAKLSPSSIQDTPKTRSLDRRHPEPIVLTKWRHSTHIPDNEKPSEKCGLLNFTKITENGKKLRKNWTSSWTVLQGSSLLFAKSQGGGTSWFGSHQSKPECSVDLRGATVEWAKDKSSKKHVLELKTRQGMELLIQSDNESVINEWLRAIAEAINTHAWESDEAIEEDMPESPSPEKHDLDKEHRDSKKHRGGSLGGGMKSSSSMDVSDHRKRTKLKKFLTRRPTLQAVRDKGYIKDQVFGCSLSSLCQRENTSVPHFVRMCIEHVESNGLNVDGLYRVSGNLAVIQKLRFAVNHDERVDLQDSKWEDIHVTTGALKMFFRELPEPLFTHTHFQEFVNAIKIPDYRQRVQAIRDLVKQLPRPNHDTMQALFKHLKRVVEHGEENRMTAQSVAIVFGPTLLRPETESWNMAVHMVYQNQIVELVLLEIDSIFRH